MKGSPKVIEVLNKTLCLELTGINQYFIHSKMCKDWGYHALAKHAWDESIEEMKHADKVIERILFLEGKPDMSTYDVIRIGGTVREQMANDLKLEHNAVNNLRNGIKICLKEEDHVTRELLEHILCDEEEHIDWLETQLNLIEEVSYENYLAKQMGGHHDHHG
ncbi:bacterioferritin [Acanthopleuribacter pedis]|uniref:Bacterioferritin n=1 Tax=Acanthopleuribacter pedis TaxID=442870 RepID=A0A8J7Q8B7_9BACT|nr:bacterioferritin [Acanthopleuribacter pedis]MBO1319557.1 bacterioferritin [Acanthopleuribacter pedis]